MRALPTASLTKLPRQRRSMTMVHTIVDAAIRVIAREGVEAFSTNQVAASAGVSIGSLYQYFANKEMILAAVLERGILESAELMRERAIAESDAPIDEVLREVLYALLDQLEPARFWMRDVFSLVPFVCEGGVLSILEIRVGDVVRDYLLRHSDRYELVGGPAAVYVGVNGITYVVLRWLTDAHRTIEKAEMIETLVAMLGAIVREASGKRGGKRGRAR